MKKIVYVDMDDVLADFKGEFFRKRKIHPEIKYPQSIYKFFENLDPIEGSIDGVLKLSEKYDVYILTRPSVLNPLCYTEKRVWIEKYLGIDFCHKLILSPNKSLSIGDYLIDDVKWNFKGEQLLFGSERFPDWNTVLKYML